MEPFPGKLLRKISILTGDIYFLIEAILISNGDIVLVVSPPFGSVFTVDERANWCYAKKLFQLELLLDQRFTSVFYDVFQCHGAPFLRIEIEMKCESVNWFVPTVA